MENKEDKVLSIEEKEKLLKMVTIDIKTFYRNLQNKYNYSLISKLKKDIAREKTKENKKKIV